MTITVFRTRRAVDDPRRPGTHHDADQRGRTLGLVWHRLCKGIPASQASSVPVPQSLLNVAFPLARQEDRYGIWLGLGEARDPVLDNDRTLGQV